MLPAGPHSKPRSRQQAPKRTPQRISVQWGRHAWDRVVFRASPGPGTLARNFRTGLRILTFVTLSDVNSPDAMRALSSFAFSPRPLPSSSALSSAFSRIAVSRSASLKMAPSGPALRTGTCGLRPCVPPCATVRPPPALLCALRTGAAGRHGPVGRQLLSPVSIPEEAAPTHSCEGERKGLITCFHIIRQIYPFPHERFEAQQAPYSTAPAAPRVAPRLSAFRGRSLLTGNKQRCYPHARGRAERPLRSVSTQLCGCCRLSRLDS